MTGRRKPSGRQAPWPWQPMYRAVKIEPTDEQIERARAGAVEQGLDPDVVEAQIRAEAEMWRNDRYVAVVRRDPAGHVVELSLRRVDRKPDFPWRHLQRIKNEVAGREVEAIELFPAESRLVDTANQRWLWCLPPGVRFPVGFNDGRVVADPDEAAAIGARQSAFEVEA